MEGGGLMDVDGVDGGWTVETGVWDGKLTCSSGIEVVPDAFK